ncbi:DUF21 domain-containing protein [Erysiphe neolycopersici]|uniref:DUF21 domain-containing protein n=1 Tax=Erysiphe neolycopersici TaxID=212602 RepID=A0A420H815_9PEZI|nr:DUF21 domain-containing protein [Erysiphe neolycopersici]
MLCSLIICTVACSEYFPFVIQNLFLGPPWIAILISTICITLFVELIPQFFIPARPLTWSYYCRPMIWTCMWVTAIVSWPISLFLSHISLKTNDRSVFSNDELKAFIKYHEKSEKKGGELGREASQVMIGALNLDNRVIGEVLFGQQSLNLRTKIDSEKAGQHRQKGIITRWSSVKTIDIDEMINNDFIKKISCWSYSRLPVVGTHRKSQCSQKNKLEYHLEDIQIYGSLHLNNLIRYIDTGNSSLLSVKDLPLDPLPVVQVNMSAYALLNMFENGVSKMAIVIPAKNQEKIAFLKRMPCNISICSHVSTKDCLYTQAMNFKAQQDLKKGVHTKYMDSNLAEVASMNANKLNGFQNSVYEKRITRPIGLITLDDLVGTIFQRTCHDEKAINSRCSDNLPTKNGFKHTICNINDAYNTTLMKSDENSQRQCKYPSKDEAEFINGVNDRKFHHHFNPGLNNQKTRNDRMNSFIIKRGNSNNNKRRDSADTRIVSHMRRITPLLDSRLSSFDNNLVTTSKNSTFPSRKKSLINIKGPFCHRSASTVVPMLPKISRVTPFSCRNESGYCIKKCYNKVQQESLSPGPKNLFKSLSFPELPINPLDSNLYKFQTTYEENFGNNMAHKSFLGNAQINYIADLSTHESSTLYKEGNLCGKVYARALDHGCIGGFFREISEAKNKENITSKHLFHTLPRFKGTNISLSPERNRISCDDRTLLPSQRTALRSASLYAIDNS